MTPAERLIASWDEAFNTAPAAAAELFAPDAEYRDHRPLGWPAMQGRDAIREWFETMGDAITAASRVVAESPPLAAVEQVFSFVAPDADGGGQGEVTVAVLLRIEDDLITHLELFDDPAQAEAALSAA